VVNLDEVFLAVVIVRPTQPVFGVGGAVGMPRVVCNDMSDTTKEGGQQASRVGERDTLASDKGCQRWQVGLREQNHLAREQKEA